MRRRAAKMNITEWVAESPAKYLGAQVVDGGVAQCWGTPRGEVEIVYPDSGTVVASLSWPKELPDAVAICMVTRTINPVGGPVLDVNDGDYEITWEELSQVLGLPIPYWSPALTVVERMELWQPGGSQQTVAAKLSLEIGPLLQLAITFPEGDQTRDVLIHLAQTIQDRSTQGPVNDLDLVRESTDPNTIVIPAVPLPVPEVEDLSPAVQRGGWLPLLQRTDDLARTVIRTVVAWDSGDQFPYSLINEIDNDDPMRVEWAGRLEPSPHTAAFELMRGRDGTNFVDPVTGAPATIRGDGTCWTAAPQFIVSAEPMSEIILGAKGQVWVRTKDGVVHLAPENRHGGVRWGYKGGSPTTLAVLIEQLLDGANLHAVTDHKKPNKNLAKIAYHRWPVGTVFTREQLIAARNGTFTPPETA